MAVPLSRLLSSPRSHYSGLLDTGLVSTGGGHVGPGFRKANPFPFCSLSSAMNCPPCTGHHTSMRPPSTVRMKLGGWGQGDREDCFPCLGKPMQLLGLADLGLEYFYILSGRRLSSQHLGRVTSTQHFRTSPRESTTPSRMFSRLLHPWLPTGPRVPLYWCYPNLAVTFHSRTMKPSLSYSPAGPQLCPQTPFMCKATEPGDTPGPTSILK